MIKNKKIEIFCGTGGVGKTTLATSRAINLARKSKKVLLITIDPAKRLKQILNMKDEASGTVVTINNHQMSDPNSWEIDALLMSPRATLMRIAELNQSESDFDNSIMRTLSRAYGGLNEIMSVIEVQHHLSTGNYDCIVLDTPPGSHFIDFLEGTKKINEFFDKTFVEIFKVLGKSYSSTPLDKTGVFTKILKTGVKKLLSYLEKVTGEDFVEEFIHAVAGLYRNKESFLAALDFQEDLKKSSFSNWFLVTSAEQCKIIEADELSRKAKGFMHDDNFLVVNKSLLSLCESWTPKEDSPLHSMRETMLNRESSIAEEMGFPKEQCLHFPEILEANPENHVLQLANSWN